MGTERDSPREKLLDACGVEKPRPAGKPVPQREDRNYFEALVDQADSASVSAQKAQEQTEKLYRQFRSYLHEELPGELVKAFEKVAREGIEAKLRPLDKGIAEAAQQVGECAAGLRSISWNGRLLWVAVLVGMGTTLVGGFVVRCSFFGDEIREAQSHETLGRQVNKRYGAASANEREWFLRWLQGEHVVPQASPQNAGARAGGKSGRMVR